MIPYFQIPSLPIFDGVAIHPFGVLVDAAAAYGVPVDHDRLHRLRGGGPAPWPLPNVHLLTSTENQDAFDARVPYLLACPAVVHGISAEPLLGPIDMGLDRWVRIRETVRADRIPGVRLPGDDVQDQKRTLTPKLAIERGASGLVVGRPIVEAKDPRQAALDYSMAWVESSFKA